MREKGDRLRIIVIVFAIVVLLSGGMILINYSNYLGLLKSIDEVTFSIDEMTHRDEGNTVEVSIFFSVVNPTSYSGIRFSSLQCQLYMVINGEEEYLGTTGYAPPVDVPLRENEVRTYTTSLSISRNNIVSLNDGVLEAELEWRVRNVVHYSTPIRRYYQTINVYQVSFLQD